MHSFIIENVKLSFFSVLKCSLKIFHLSNNHWSASASKTIGLQQQQLQQQQKRFPKRRKLKPRLLKQIGQKEKGGLS